MLISPEVRRADPGRREGLLRILTKVGEAVLTESGYNDDRARDPVRLINVAIVVLRDVHHAAILIPPFSPLLNVLKFSPSLFYWFISL